MHADPPACDICAVASRKIVRFSLIHGRMVNGRRTTRGAGVIQLCERCWRQTAARRTRAALTRVATT